MGRPKVSDELLGIVVLLAGRGSYLAEHRGRYLLVLMEECRTIRVNPRRGHSMIVRELVEQKGEKDGSKIYTLSPKGLKMAEGR